MNNISDYELVEIIAEYFQGDAKEVVAEINALISRARTNGHKLSNNLELALEEWCSVSDVCTECGEYLQSDTSSESVEYCGSMVNMQCGEVYCPNCN